MEFAISGIFVAIGVFVIANKLQVVADAIYALTAAVVIQKEK